MFAAAAAAAAAGNFGSDGGGDNGERCSRLGKMAILMKVMMGNTNFGLAGCPFYSFTCDDETCISLAFVCDIKEDCQDGSDEHHCGRFIRKITE